MSRRDAADVGVPPTARPVPLPSLGGLSLAPTRRDAPAPPAPPARAATDATDATDTTDAAIDVHEVDVAPDRARASVPPPAAVDTSYQVMSGRLQLDAYGIDGANQRRSATARRNRAESSNQAQREEEEEIQEEEEEEEEEAVQRRKRRRTILNDFGRRRRPFGGKDTQKMWCIFWRARDESEYD